MRIPELLWSNAVIAVAASACAMRTLVLVEADVTGYPSAVFCLGIGGAAWLAYTWQRHVKSTRTNGLRTPHLLWHVKHRSTLKKAAVVAAVLSIAPLAMTLTKIKTAPQEAHPFVLLAFAVASATTLLYAGLPGEVGQRLALRRLPGMKMVWVSFSWTIVTAAWPGWWSGALLTLTATEWTAILGERFLVITALTLPFDLRDRQWDAPAMQNWTRTLGQRGTRCLAMFCLASAATGLWFTQKDAAGWALIGLIPMGIAVAYAKEDRPASYFGWLDGLLVLDGLWLMLKSC